MTGEYQLISKTKGAIEVMEYLRAHGPASTGTMRSDGIDVPKGLFRKLHDKGIVRPVGREGNAKIWEAVK